MKVYIVVPEDFGGAEGDIAKSDYVFSTRDAAETQKLVMIAKNRGHVNWIVVEKEVLDQVPQKKVKKIKLRQFKLRQYLVF